MDPAALFNLALAVGTVLAAGAVSIVVGRRRGIDKVEARTDAEIEKTLDAQARRLALQELEIADLKAQVAALTGKVAALTAELDIERRITARFRSESQP